MGSTGRLGSGLLARFLFLRPETDNSLKEERNRACTFIRRSDQTGDAGVQRERGGQKGGKDETAKHETDKQQGLTV